jgi:hypothetical protein
MKSILVASSMAIALCVCGLWLITPQTGAASPNGTARTLVGYATSRLDFTFGSFFRLSSFHEMTQPEAETTDQATDPPNPLPLDRSTVGALIRAAALRHQVPEAFVKSIVAAESNFNSNAVSPKGAIGLMQLLPATARQYGADPTVPEQNVEAGTRYLRCLMERYRRHPITHVIAAYNAGPSAVDHFRGVPPFRETRGYVSRVLSFLRRFVREPAGRLS